MLVIISCKRVCARASLSAYVRLSESKCYDKILGECWHILFEPLAAEALVQVFVCLCVLIVRRKGLGKRVQPLRTMSLRRRATIACERGCKACASRCYWPFVYLFVIILRTSGDFQYPLGICVNRGWGECFPVCEWIQCVTCACDIVCACTRACTRACMRTGDALLVERHLYVADSGNSYVQMLSTAGNFERYIGKGVVSHLDSVA